MTKMISHTDNKNTVHRNLPAKAWSATDYNRHAKNLLQAFIANFKKFKASFEIITAGPELI